MTPRRFVAWHPNHGALDGNWTVSGPDGVHRSNAMTKAQAKVLADRLNREWSIA